MMSKAQYSALYKNATRIAPGLYVQSDNTVIVNAIEILDHLGWERSAENIDLACQAGKDVFRDKGVACIELRPDAVGNCSAILHMPPHRSGHDGERNAAGKDGAA